MSTHPLSRLLARTFKPAAAPRHDPYRKTREEAKKLAAEIGVDIERDGGSLIVWPPKASPGGRLHWAVLEDPFEGDHYCQNWSGALHMVRVYAGLEKA